MASTDYSTYSQAAAQQGYSAYTASHSGYAETTQAYGQQSYGTYGQPTDVSYTRLRPLQPMGRRLCNFLWTASHWIFNSAAPRHTVSLSRDTALALTTPPLPQLRPPRPPMQLSLHMVLSLPTQLWTAASSHTNRKDRRMVTNTLRLVNLSLAQGVTTSPSLGCGQGNYGYPQVPGSLYPMQPVSAPPSYPSTQLLLIADFIPDQSSYSQQNTWAAEAATGSRVAPWPAKQLWAAATH